MSYSLIDLSENAQDNRYPITNHLGLLYIAILNGLWWSYLKVIALPQASKTIFFNKKYSL
jgi:hypothetical protein